MDAPIFYFSSVSTTLLSFYYYDRWVVIYTYGGELLFPDGYIRPVVRTLLTDLDYKIYLLLKFTVPK
jgi:hypothetical protein